MQSLTFDDVLLIPSYNGHSSRKDVITDMVDKTKKLTLGIPILTANMDTVTGHEMAKFIYNKGGIGVLHRFMTVEENCEEYRKSPKDTFVSIGASEKELERFSALKSQGAEYFCVDVAHGHATYVGKMIKEMRDIAGNNVCIIAGNVATYAGADYLASCGADIIKVGIGPGSVCSTRIKTGFGVSQLTAIKDCSRVDRSIIADGGIRTPGDIVKALAFGADFVMIGGMLAGTRPTPGKVLTYKTGQEYSNKNTTINDGIKKYKSYRGMASKEVADEYHGGLAEWKTAEGVATEVNYREDEDEIIADIVGGLRSGLTYGGAANIKELQRKLNYMTVTSSTVIENKPHKTL